MLRSHESFLRIAVKRIKKRLPEGPSVEELMAIGREALASVRRRPKGIPRSVYLTYVIRSAILSRLLSERTFAGELLRLQLALRAAAPERAGAAASVPEALGERRLA